MLKKFINSLKIIDPDAEPREVVEDAHMLADERRQDVTVRRNGTEATVHFKSGSKSLTGVRTPERK